MRLVTYRDPAGRNIPALIPNHELDAMAPLVGLRLGPPDLSALGVCDAFAVALHNELIARGIYTIADARRNMTEVRNAILTAAKIDANRLVNAWEAAAGDVLELPPAATAAAITDRKPRRARRAATPAR